MNKKVLAVYDIILNLQINNLQSKIIKGFDKKKELKELMVKQFKK